MTENPYDSPAHSKPNGSGRRSWRPHGIASILVVSFWSVMIAALLWFCVVSVADGNVSIEYTPQPDPTDPFNPIISTHIFYVSTIDALTLVGAAVAVSLAVVNTTIAFWPRVAVT